MEKNEAVKELLKVALYHGEIVRGIRESVKALDQRSAVLCFLSKSCDEPQYTKLIKALCTHHGIKLVEVEDSKQLGEWAGLCKINKEGKACKIIGSGCVVIKNFGKESPACDAIQKYLTVK